MINIAHHIFTRRLNSACTFHFIRRQHSHFSHPPHCGPNHTPSQLRRPISQPTPFTHPHLLRPNELTPNISRHEYIHRRRALAQNLPPNSLSVFPSNPQHYMTEDVPYLYHPNNDLLYISAVAEPSAFLAAHRPSQPDETVYTLFVTHRDPAQELWHGPICGPTDDVRNHFALDDIRSVNDFPAFLADNIPHLHSFHFDPSINPQVTRHLTTLDNSHQNALLQRWDRSTHPKKFLQSIRLIKSQAEIVLLRRSAQIISLAFNEAMAAFRASPSMEGQPQFVAERDIQAVLYYECLRQGADRMAFPSVVAAGRNSTVLHHMRNDGRAFSGDFVMVDAGCEVHGYCSDVSRSWPMSGVFSSAQRDLYQLVLQVQRKCIDIALEGVVLNGDMVTLDHMHSVAARELTEGLFHLGFFKGHSLESAFVTRAYEKYFPHAIGHYLGMDVHDTHDLRKNLPLKRDMVLTVEPGLCCAIDDESAPEAFRGIGMRLEDDIVVGDRNVATEVLSKDAVKSVEDIEQMVGSRPR